MAAHETSLLITNARIVTPPALGPRRGTEMNELRVLEGVSVRVRDGVIEQVAPKLAPEPGDTVIDARGCVVMPGFVDSHTHACFAGSRLDEWEQRLAGVSYLDVLRRGGGIMHTVRETRAASPDDLAATTRERLLLMVESGSTTIEVKSGYGLTADAELKMLRAISEAAIGVPATVAATALLGHAIDPESSRSGFIDTTVRETLDAVHREFPAVPIDAFCEDGAWTKQEATLLLARARDLGHPVRIHADQFNSLGMVEAAIELGARSVDHLEASTPHTLHKLADSPTIGVGLPCCGVHMTGRGGAGGMFADLRTLVDLGGACAIATNFNPGSAPCYSMPTAMAAAVRCCGLTWREAITAATVNSAAVLGLTDRGAIVPGARADIVMLRHRDEREICFEFGSNPVRLVIVGGRIVGDETADDDHLGL